MDACLFNYVSMVDFMAEVLGESTEVLLFDLEDWDHSVVAIRNGHISGREVGAPVSDTALKFLRDKAAQMPFVTNFYEKAIDGTPLRCSAWFIRNERGDTVGMLCVRSDYSRLMQAQKALNIFCDGLILGEDIPVASVEEEGTLDVSAQIEQNLHKVYPTWQKKGEDLSRKDKHRIVEELYDMGTFMLKGGVAQIAPEIGLSVPTLYRYLDKLKAR